MPLIIKTTYNLKSGKKNYTQKYKLQGRSIETATGISFDHSANIIEFNAYCAGDVKLTVNTGGKIYFTVITDGVKREGRQLASGVANIILGEGLEEGVHTFRVIRQTENKYGTAELQSLTLSGALLDPDPASDYYIEFIGDSITACLGNLCRTPDMGGVCGTDEPNAHESSKEEDASQGYAYLTASVLGADLGVVAVSGIGVARSWNGTNLTWNTNAFTWWRAQSYIRSKNVAQNFSQARKPDLVVINLGTNDEMLLSAKDSIGRPALTESEYKEKVQALIEGVRTSYGDDSIKILWIGGVMNDNLATWTSAAISELGGESAGLYYNDNMPKGKSGGNGHPNVTQHQAVASALIPVVAGILGIEIG